ncbi:MAG: hypothetical protein IJT01_04445 [Selenomonadaceae bacterium]|nr:hypothetical protein [Selenomonadaceae bacterium]
MLELDKIYIHLSGDFTYVEPTEKSRERRYSLRIYVRTMIFRQIGISGEERIWKFLKDKGLNDFAVAGVMGNLYAESGLSPINLEKLLRIQTWHDR